MIDEETDRLLGRYEEQLKMQGISLDLYYQITNTKEEDLRNQIAKESEKNVKYRLMLEEISTKENVKITDEEADKEATELSQKYGMEKDEFLKSFGGLEMINYDLEIRKVVDILKENKIDIKNFYITKIPVILHWCIISAFISITT